jgi:aarF domain-containing kinase
MPRVMRANPVVELPGDVLLIGRVLGLLSGVSKQLGSEVDVATLLMPYIGRIMTGTTAE